MPPLARRSARREELLDAEGNIEGVTSEPLVSQLPLLGRSSFGRPEFLADTAISNTPNLTVRANTRSYL